MIYDEDGVRSIEVEGEGPLAISQGTLVQTQDEPGGTPGLKDWEVHVRCAEPCFLDPGGPYELILETDEGDTYKGRALLKSATSFEALLFKGAGDLIQQN